MLTALDWRHSAALMPDWVHFPDHKRSPNVLIPNAQNRIKSAQ
ncbi:Uncharacterised protein [Vibrio cholerae]|nr:Uncharacterised protein [Vibrio cholerae]